MGNEKPTNSLTYGKKGEKSRELSLADIDINPKAKISAIEQEKMGTYKCVCCGKEFNTQVKNFPSSKSIIFKGNNGYVPICKDCVDKLFQQLVGFYNGNEEHAIERCCQLFDWYYSPQASAMTKNISKGHSRVTYYPSKMSIIQIARQGSTYLDTIKERNLKKITPENIKTDDENKEISSVSEDTIKFFGYGYTAEEYEFLQEEFNDWTTTYNCDTKAKKEIFKNITIAQLVIQRAQRKGSSKEISEAMKSFQDLLGTANIKPNQDKENISDSDTFGTLIKKLETERPVSTPKDEWRDVDGIRNYIDTYFTGHLCNLLHIENDHAENYKREMEKYTVKPPVYEEDDTLSDTSLLDKYAEKKDDE